MLTVRELCDEMGLGLIAGPEEVAFIDEVRRDVLTRAWDKLVRH